MSTTTIDFAHSATARETSAVKPSFFDRLIAARTRQGESRVRSVFGRMSDGQLADIGFTADQIRQVRATGKIPAEYWAA